MVRKLSRDYDSNDPAAMSETDLRRELSILMPEREKEVKEIKNIGYCLLDDLAPVDLQHPDRDTLLDIKSISNSVFK